MAIIIAKAKNCLETDLISFAKILNTLFTQNLPVFINNAAGLQKYVSGRLQKVFSHS